MSVHTERSRVLVSTAIACAAMAAAVLFGCGWRPAEPSQAELSAFRQRVLAILATEYPARHFEPMPDPHLVKLGDAQLGLQNLYAIYAQSDGSDAELRRLVRKHFDSVLQQVDAAVARQQLPWEAARPLLRPQIVPIEYTTRMPTMVHLPFARAAAAAVVVDQPTSYQYVTAEDLARWHVGADDVRAAAAANLERMLKDADLESNAGPDRFLVVETHDGYDAARLLLPSFRDAIAKRLGSPFHAAVPNRDRLFLWPADASASFQQHTRGVVREDFHTDPYPLSQSVFEVGPNGVRELPD